MGLVVINSAQRILNINTEYGSYNSDTTQQHFALPDSGYIKYIAMSRGPGNNQQYFSIYNEETATTYSNIFSIGNQATVGYQAYGPTDIPFGALERMRIIQENAGTQGKPISNTTFYVEVPSIASNTISFIGSYSAQSDPKTQFIIGNNPYSFGAGSINTSGSSITSLGFTLPVDANLVSFLLTANEAGVAVTNDTTLDIRQNGSIVEQVFIPIGSFIANNSSTTAFTAGDRVDFVCVTSNASLTSSSVLAIFEMTGTP